LGDFPAFGAGKGTGFADDDEIAFSAFVLFVVGLIFFGFNDDFPVLRVGRSILNGNNDGFLHLVADDDAGKFFYCHILWRGLFSWFFTLAFDSQKLAEFVFGVFDDVGLF
jgi:membrane-associated PAP2 superfamily phosphatase